MANQNESKILVYMIMLFGLLMGFLYSTSVDVTADVPILDVKLQTSALQNVRSAKIDDLFVTLDDFTSLRVFGSLPVIPTAGGRSNPFQ